MHFDIMDELTPEQPWQPLESILTVWIEMIQRKKIVALPDKVGKQTYENLDDGSVRVIEGPERDPATGAKRLDGATSPWTIVPYALKDLEETLEVWGMAVDIIEQKMGLPKVEQSDRFLDVEALDAARIPDGFARKFLSQARRPRFKFIAPGLCVPTKEDFFTQPFIHQIADLEDEDNLPPMLLFRGDATVDTEPLDWFGFQPDLRDFKCPCGVYLNACQRSYRYPQEDGCTLVLPFKLDAGWAKKSDFSRVDNNDSLLQSGINPYIDAHPVQLQALVENVYRHIQREDWEVDANGVAGGIDKWNDADTEQEWSKYFVNLGPGRYW